MSFLEIQYKVDINPSYEWAEEASKLNISHRELEVFALVTEGYSNKEVAQILKIKHQSVKNHMHKFNNKLSAKNNTQAFIIAIHLNLIKVSGRLKDFYPEVVTEITSEKMIDGFRKIISGESWSHGVKEKNIQALKVFLREHGIDPDDW